MAQFSADGDAGDASVLNFGSVSASTDGDVQFLMNHEVVYALTRLRYQREENGEQVPNVMERALEHCKDRAGCEDLDMTKMLSFTQSVHSQLDAMIDEEIGDEHEAGMEKLHRFEIASLVNLMDSDQQIDPNDPTSQLDECVKIIPSLDRFSKDFLTDVMQVLKREREELKLDVGETLGDEDEDEDADADADADADGDDAGAGSMEDSQEGFDGQATAAAAEEAVAEEEEEEEEEDAAAAAPAADAATTGESAEAAGPEEDADMEDT
jgi:hypothetical protein